VTAARQADGLPGEWVAMALDPPRAQGLPAVAGRLRCAPADFVVEERLGFEPDGGAAHILLRVEKTDANTMFVARQLARECGCHPRDVGFAGLKDRRAVARQWFSVPARRAPEAWAGTEGEGFRVLAAHAHSRKLRQGALAGNRFEIRVRHLEGDTGDLAERLARVARDGVPNYFGPQRFGREASNLARVLDWVSGAPLPRDRSLRSLVLSTARSLCFNAAAAARVCLGSWNRLLEGELVNLDGSGSIFLAEAIDAGLVARCAAGDVHPTGPLPGVGGPAPQAAAADIERQALSAYDEVIARLSAFGVESARRPLRCVPQSLQWSSEAGALELRFALPRGAFATAVLREVVMTVDEAGETGID
jgi:tRNA pseudouridine13 synthase